MAAEIANTGDVAEAIGQLEAVVAEQPGNADAWGQLADRYLKCGRNGEAVKSLRQRVRLRPADAHAHNLLAITLAKNGQMDEALAQFQQALQVNPKYAPTYHNLGVTLAGQEKFEEAVKHFRQALALDGEYVEAHRNLGMALLSLKRKEEAVASFRQVLRLAPDHADAMCSLANTLTELRRSGEGVILLRQVVRLRPGSADAHNSLGLAQLAEGQLTAAEASFEEALRLQPRYASAHNNLGTACKEQGRLEEAVASYDLALAYEPQSPSIHWNRSLALLQMGDMERGWEEYEWRWRRPHTPPRSFPQPLWAGEPLEGKTILLHAEQGLGDTLQFIRYAPLVQRRGGRVIFECPSPLGEACRRCAGVDEFLVEGQPLPKFDVHLPLMSLPRIFKTTCGIIPAQVPYVQVEPGRIEHWAQKVGQLAAAGKMKVGIAWQGNPHHARDRFRSVPLVEFEPLAKREQLQLFSVQRGPGVEQAAAVKDRVPVIELTDGKQTTGSDLADTAAIMRSLDLVITVDTATAHLAGALGVPVWTVLGAVADWRWMLKRKDTPWYPTMRLFRQHVLGDWGEVIERTAAAVTAVAQRTAQSSWS